MIDRYTKVTLTIIAACLLWNVLHDAMSIRPATAQNGGQVHVVVDAWGAYLATLPIPVRAQQ
jgi:hypothetical protein